MVRPGRLLGARAPWALAALAAAATTTSALAAPAGAGLAAPGAAAASRAIVPGGLPRDVVPGFQAVHLRVDADTTHYSGRVVVELDVRRPVATVQLHARGQTLDRVRLTQGGKEVPVRRERGARGLLTLTADRRLARGKATLEIRFTQAFNTKAVALYRMAKEGRAYTFTQFQAEDAREAFPCWDEPSFKFPYQLTLEVPEGHEAVSNTPVEREVHGLAAVGESAARRWKTVVFRRTPPLPSYLLAIATGPLEFTPIPGLGVPARVVTVQGQSHLTALAVEWTPKVLRAAEGWFGGPYPFEKLDLIAVPEYWAGAMENPGAITYADGVLLLDPATASPAQRKNLVRITAHELAHMWFGDLVTMAWWDDLWLNESFADWLGDKLTDRLMPEYRHLLDELQDIQGIMATDARPTTDAIRQPVATGDEAMRSIGIAYNKGKAVLAMFEQWLGPEAFRRGVRDYLRAHEWGNAVAADLWRALAGASGKDVSAVMGGFLEKPGFPLVTVEPLAGGGVRLSQRRFLNHGVAADPQAWKIPMILKYSDGSRVRTTEVLLEGATATVTLEGAAPPVWILPNAAAGGYYRWSVPPEMMVLLARQAGTALDAAERIGFLGNLTSLLDAGEIRGDEFLRALAEMADDPEPLVAAAVISGLEKARQAFVPDTARAAFAGFVRRALRPMADRFGLEKRPGEAEAISLLRPAILITLGRDGRDQAVLGYADALAEKYMAEPAAVDPSVAGVALQLRALRGDGALYERYREALESAATPTLRRQYLSALGCFDEPAIQERALRYALQGTLRPNELFAIPGGIGSGSERGADRAFAWMLENYDRIASRLPESFLPSLPRLAGGCSAERMATARTFFAEPAHVAPGTQKRLEQVAEQVKDCVGLRQREGAAVAAYLEAVAGK